MIIRVGVIGVGEGARRWRNCWPPMALEPDVVEAVNGTMTICFTCPTFH